MQTEQQTNDQSPSQPSFWLVTQNWRENGRDHFEHGLGFTSDWLSRWLEFLFLTNHIA